MSEGFRIVHSTGCILSPNDSLALVKILGRGTQGTAYHVRSSNNEEYALKLYHSSTLEKDKSIHSRLKKLVKIGSPSKAFCWALDYLEVDFQNSTYYGYIMKLRPPNYISPAAFLNGDCQLDFKPLFTACLNLADSFSQLHLRGLCYKDVSINNFFFNPDCGDCSIIDIDNICYDSAYDYSANVLGTPRFMAPEIVDGQSKPSIYTDYHSLAVLLFYLLLRGNPLEGAREAKIRIFDAAAQKYLYGTDATYIFDLNDSTNRPDPEFHAATLYMANILPESLMATFDLAFSQGLHDPGNRVPDSKWSIEVRRIIDSITHCPSCGQENFCSPPSLQNMRCWECGHDFNPLRIQDQFREYLVSPGVTVESGGRAVATVIRHPKDKLILGLRNDTDITWDATLPEDKKSEVPPGKSIIIGSGIVLDTQSSDAIVLKIL
ncbi:serine/threonine-protein kinase [Cyanobium sp. A2C-AMD]|uniref:serine/threonine protein kinase n=1 Tax=Cyanobium sp. A2C-AMD TaxID=2823695 RepID=UPI0020CEA569|nr:serine/threonine-protein kinase [Cyanobium sp. A2C-AMD]MCP9877929.1 serine/threonine protein kinase [Cyanobium sp. A2C-AMD]